MQGNFHTLQENMLQYEVAKYKKGVYLAPRTKKLEDVELTRK